MGTLDAEYFRFLGEILTVLEAHQIRYAIGGSFASSIYGEFRYTFDVDMSIQLFQSHVESFVSAFEKLDWYVFDEGIERAIREGGSFQVIDGGIGLKADFYVLSSPPNPANNAHSTGYAASAMEMGTKKLILCHPKM